MFEVIANESFDARERRILSFWQKERIFERSVEEHADRPLFVSYDGPPFATGLPHYGHLLTGTIKDVVYRFKTMEGYYVPRRFGWDCHGLPVEQEVEKSHGLSGAASIEAYGIASFNEACRSIVTRYTEEWKATVHRMGRWVDFKDTYRTMDPPFMETVWWVFKQLYDQGLVYEGFRVMPYSAKLGTPLSNFEAGENYKDVDDPSITVALALEGGEDTYLLVWTTTPWTLISNLAVMVGPDIEYSTILEEASQRRYIVATARLGEVFADRPYAILDKRLGSELAGLSYKPLFPYFADKKSEGAFRVILEDTVSLDDGTGLVQSAPAFGEVDFYACQRAGVPLVCPVDANGQFTAEIPEYTGLFVKDADSAIIRRIKAQGVLFRQATLRHRYPFCYRSDTPLIYRAMSTWFVAVEKFKERLQSANAQIDWVPDHIKEGRFGKWLEGARDWNISRNRYWGTPIPLWRSDDGECIAIGSREDLEELTGANPEDLHRHFIDHLTIEKGGKTYRRIPEVFDCWFESGSMPYAQLHYPFENKDFFDSTFPADFIAEGLDQTRGWFYTLTVLAAALFDKPAFKNVVVNGIILAEDGAKMSKRLRNYPDPSAVIGKYGADAIRLYMLHSPAVRAESLCFAEGGVELVLRQVLIPWWNAYSFFATYARIASWQPLGDAAPALPEDILDRWLLARLNGLIGQVRAGMDDYVLSRAVEPLVGFIDALTNWYIRRSRRRFWTSDTTEENASALSTLYYTLLQLCKVAAPFVPFLAEAIYGQLRLPAMSPSIHLTSFPERHHPFDDPFLEKAMDALQTVVSLGHALRKEQKIKVRQPLPSLKIACADFDLAAFFAEHSALIAEELNVKAVILSANDSAYVEYGIKPNFRLLGKKVGQQMRAAQAAIANLGQEGITALLQGESIVLNLEGHPYTLTPEDVEIARTVRTGCVAATSGNLTILLDTSLNDVLLIEGLAREVVNKINTMRREASLAVTDRIDVHLETTPRVIASFTAHGDYIRDEVLATSVTFGPCPNGAEWDLNGEATKISIYRS